jgi:hypothetical protein
VMRTWPSDLVTSWGGAAIVEKVYVFCTEGIRERLSIVRHKKKIDNKLVYVR